MSLCFPWSFLPPRSCYFLKGCVFSWLCRTVGPVATDSLKLVQFFTSQYLSGLIENRMFFFFYSLCFGFVSEIVWD